MVACRMPAHRGAKRDRPWQSAGWCQQQIEKLGIVDDFGARASASQSRMAARVLFSTSLAMNARLAGLGGNFDAEHARAEAFLIRLFGIERQPHGGFLARRESRRETLCRRPAIRGRVSPSAAVVGDRREFAQQRSESQLGVKLAQRDGIGLAESSAPPDRAATGASVGIVASCLLSLTNSPHFSSASR